MSSYIATAAIPTDIPANAQAPTAYVSSFSDVGEMLLRTLRTFSQSVTRGVLKSYNDLEIIGQERLPKQGSYVLVANHSSHLDAVCLQAATPWHRRHRVFAAAAADYFFSNIWTSIAAKIGVNALPFQRQGGGAESLKQCRELLDRKGSSVLVIFPEGTRAPNGEIGRFRSGVGRLVAGTEVPVVPCYLEGAHDALPKGGRFLKPRKLVLRIGKPLVCNAEPDDFEGVQGFVEQVREDVLKLREA